MAFLQSADSSAHLDPIELQDISQDASVRENGRARGSKEGIREDVTPPDTAVEALQMWNEPRINMWRVFATLYSFFIFGMNDGAYGVRFPFLNLQQLNANIV